MNVKKSKIKIVTPIIILTVIVFGLITPISARASVASFLGLDDMATDLVIAIGSAVAYLLNWLLKAAASFFEGMLGIGFAHTLDTIKIGWTACRDFANMLFILFMVIIAFGTILRIEQYGIKKLLPKVIIVALLINFSMVFCSIIIDFSNLTADFFIKDIKGKISAPDGGNGAITATFADAMAVNKVQVAYANCDEFLKAALAECDKIILGNWAACISEAATKKEDCDRTGSVTVRVEGKDFLNVFLGYTVSSIIMIIAAFALFAGGIMLLFRIVAIWFLVTITPLVFICYILPGLKSNWQKWWKTFLNWCIFAPAYAFFIWMAIQIASSNANKNMGAKAGQYTISGNYGPLLNQFVTSPGEKLIGYFVIIFFLVGGLIVAKSLGIYGADTVMKMATDAKKGATNWSKRKFVTRPAELAGGAAQRFGGKAIKSVPGLRTFGAKIEARGKLAQQKMLSDNDIKRAKQLYEQFSPEDLSNAMKSKAMNLTPAEKLALAQVASSDKYKNKIDSEAANSAANTLQGFGYEKEAKDLRGARADGEKNQAKLENMLDDMKRDGELGNLSITALEDPRVLAYLAKICKAEELDVIRNKSPRYKAAIDGSATSTTGLYALAHNPGYAGNTNIQHAYAAASGNIENLAGLSAGDRKAFANTYAKPEQLKRIKINAGSFGGNGDMQADLISGISPGTLGTFLTSADKDTAFYTVRFIKANRNNATHPEVNALYRVIASDPKLDALG